MSLHVMLLCEFIKAFNTKSAFLKFPNTLFFCQEKPQK